MEIKGYANLMIAIGLTSLDPAPNLQPPMNPFLAVFLQSIVASLAPVLTQAGTTGVQLLEAELAKVVQQNGLPHINTAAPGASTQPVSSSSAS